MATHRERVPFVALHLLRKIEEVNFQQHKQVIRTWSRASTIVPVMIGHTISVYNGKEHIPLVITDRMLGYKLGAFCPTRSQKDKRFFKSKR